MTPFSSILIVDDEPAVRQLMSRWAVSIGITPQTAGCADEALETLQDRRCDLAILDIQMPGRDGLWLAGEMRRDHPTMAVVLATAYSELLEGTAARPPVADLMLKPFNRERFLQALDRGRAWHERAAAEVERHEQLLQAVDRQVLALRMHVNQRRAYGVSETDAMLELLGARLRDVLEHSERVAVRAADLARALDLDESIVSLVERAGRLHDIGKLALPPSLLTTAGILRPGEIAIVRRHADAGAEILTATTALNELAPIVRGTHEWFGGGGYPDGLIGEAIPLASRVLAVVDAYDAMTNDRCYRGRREWPSAAAELLRCSPSQFDPEIVTAFLEMLGRP
jgi:response regulator RpfG family c-di-GMP phosphodiesterase